MKALLNLLKSKTSQTVAGGATAGTSIAMWLVALGQEYLTFLPWDDAAFSAAATVVVASFLTALLTRITAWLRGKLDNKSL